MSSSIDLKEHFRFDEEDELTSIILPDSLTHIGDGAFFGLIGLTGIILPVNLVSIGVKAFAGCISLREITFPQRLSSLGKGAFYRCRSLTNIVLPDGLISIGEWAFEECQRLASITFNEGLAFIEEDIFYRYYGLTRVTIPASVTSIGYGAFRCTGITEIAVAEGNPSYRSIGGVLYDKAGTTLIQYPSGRQDEVYTAPDGVKHIGKGAFGVFFTGDNVSRSIYFFEDSDSIEDSASEDSVSDEDNEKHGALKSVILPESLVSIGECGLSGKFGIPKSPRHRCKSI